MILNDCVLNHTMPHSTDDLSGYEASLKTSTSTTRADLVAWNRHFDDIILRQDPAPLSSEALRGSLLLKLHYESLIAVINGVTQTQVEGDNLNAPFQTIVTLARSLINAAPPSARATPNISSDLGIESPLFVTISRCTVAALRHEALDLLKSVRRREGLWDTELVARIAQKVLSIEESEGRAVVAIRDREGKIGGLNLSVKVQELRIQRHEDHFGKIESELKVRLDFSRIDRVTGQRYVITGRLFI